jgi:hypothetical protein
MPYGLFKNFMAEKFTKRKITKGCILTFFK